MKQSSVPEGYRSITPYLKLPNCARLIEFLKKAFDGIEKARLLRPDGAVLHAELMIGDSLVMIHEAPGHWKLKPSTLYLYVSDVDATYKKAIEAGGTSMIAPTNMYYGDRVACVSDVSENDWWIATRLENPPIEEIQERATTFLKARSEAIGLS
ncbi:VOC family protein [Pedosphaera parvula]|uniref:Glyoxalase/bleomycin resistance protein/dioxygenase n=1 Tax=Pedosphaera parvula (strain Ellin514) TaxID=320771 RepID=B9XF23_PEDPL|nr:VOC family protein [Pedosphaera parvula]EEF61521.1 Glyoxalase/bleomycin resistance protein/dioxygenase [Pedosphaera parvula Ellin514]